MHVPSYITSLHALPYGFLQLDEANRIVVWNEWLVRWTRRSTESVLGKTLEELYPAESRLQGAIADLRAGSQPRVYSQHFHRYLLPVPLPDHHISGFDQMQQECYLTPLADPPGHVAMSIMDVTAVVVGQERSKASRRELARARDEAEAANRAKSDFLATMSHEIRTPMNGILGFAELALGMPLPEEAHGYVSTIHESAMSLLALINDILDISKIEAGRITLEQFAVDLFRIIERTVSLLSIQADPKGISLRFESRNSARELRALADPMRAGQVILNLVGNAIKFTSQGGVTIVLDTVGDADAAPNGIRDSGQQEAPSPTNARPSHSFLRVQIMDSGIGIATEKQPLLFKHFSQADSSTTRRFGGSGLGLAISKRLIEGMGGNIGVVSEPGKGSNFWFTLPVASGQEPAHDSTTFFRTQRALAQGSSSTVESNANFASARRVKILIAEDNLTNQRLIERLITKLGFDLKIVSNGRLAVESLQAEAFDVVLMDCHMPEMDGYAATQQIRRLEQQGILKGRGDRGSLARIPIIALTASVLQEERSHCLRCGMDDFVSKPISSQQLSLVLNKWIPSPVKSP